MRDVASRPGNPSSLHALGRLARVHRDEAAQAVRQAIGGAPADVVFTGSGDEANWLGIIGLARAQRNERGATRIVVRDDQSATVLAAVQHLVRDGFVLEDEVTESTALVVSAIDGASTGLVIAAESHHVPIHLDATRALGRVPIDLVGSGATTMALASEPIGGPRGAGALAALKGTALVPLWNGGGQEGGARSGSHAVMLIAGFGAALRDLTHLPPSPLNALDVLWAGLDLTPVRGKRLANVSCVHLDDARADLLVTLASTHGVMLGRTLRGVRAQAAADFAPEQLRQATLALAGCAHDLQKATAAFTSRAV